MKKILAVAVLMLSSFVIIAPAAFASDASNAGCAAQKSKCVKGCNGDTDCVLNCSDRYDCSK